jgi:hypothetical protein
MSRVPETEIARAFFLFLRLGEKTKISTDN